jgi:uncharacterized protein (TIGR03067 family)
VTPAVLLATALAVSAPAVKEKPPAPADPTGTWELQTRTTNGRTTRSDPGETFTFTPDGRWLQHSRGQEMISAVERRIDFDPKPSPATIDLYGKGTNPANRFRGIFKIEKDTLTMCLRHGDRPTAFESPTGSDATVYVLKRVTEGGRP